MTKTVLTTIEDVKKALNDSKYSTAFTVTSTEKSEANSYCFINLLNEEKKATSQTCFIIGFNRRNYRFSSNSDFSFCEFLKDVNVNSKNRFEVTIQKDNLIDIINQACEDYCDRHSLTNIIEEANKTTAKKKTTAKTKTA